MRYCRFTFAGDNWFAKELGLWGLAKKVSIAKSCNSLVVRIPADLARFLKLMGGEDARPAGGARKDRR